MKIKNLLVLLFLFIIIFCSYFKGNVWAQEDEIQQEYEISETEKQQILGIIDSIKEGIDLFSDTFSTFVIYTPDVTSDPIDILGKYEIKNTSIFRNVLIGITTPVLAVFIIFKGIQLITSDESSIKIREFVYRVIGVICLFLLSNFIFAYSIKINNLFIESITDGNNFSEYLIDYFALIETSIKEGNISDYAFFEFNPVVQGVGSVTSLPFTVPLFLMFLIFIFIGLQFIIRFITLYFLSIFYPLIIPFILLESTEGVVFSYFRVWFSFLIHQPIFIIGYSLVINIVDGMLTNGANFNLLLTYIGAMIFLSSINVFIGKILSESYIKLNSNIKVAAKSLFSDRGLAFQNQGGSARSIVSRSNGVKTRNHYSNMSNNRKVLKDFYCNSRVDVALGRKKKALNGVNDKRINKGRLRGDLKVKKRSISGKLPKVNKIIFNKNHLSELKKEIHRNGIVINYHDIDLNIISIKGDIYIFKDKENSIVYNYLSLEDAEADDVNKDELKKVNTKDFRLLDLNKDLIKDFDPGIISSKKIKICKISELKKFIEDNKDRLKENNIDGIAVYVVSRLNKDRSIFRINSVNV